MIQALIFDFDGLILDTETPEVRVWESIYREHGYELPVDEWSKIVGGYGISKFDVAHHLSHLTQGQLDVDSLRLRHHAESGRMIEASSVLPGVMKIIQDAKRRGLKLAIASSSPHTWVDTHLTRLGLMDYFDRIICADDVPAGRTKPNPDLFLKALHELNVTADDSIVFEDSPNGVKAARAAGIFVVAVPNPTTAGFSFEGENLRVDSLAYISLTDLMLRMRDE